MRLYRAGNRTVWFDAMERTALEAEAIRENASLAWVVRRAVRQYLGVGKLTQAASALDEQVTEVTGNHRL